MVIMLVTIIINNFCHNGGICFRRNITTIERAFDEYTTCQSYLSFVVNIDDWLIVICINVESFRMIYNLYTSIYFLSFYLK